MEFRSYPVHRTELNAHLAVVDSYIHVWSRLNHVQIMFDWDLLNNRKSAKISFWSNVYKYGNSVGVAAAICLFTKQI